MNQGAACGRVSGLAWSGVRYFTTTRCGGASAGPFNSFNLGGHTGDDPACVERNRRDLAQGLPDEPIWLAQVHGSAVLDADAWQGRGAPQADAAVTTRAGRVLAIMTADCLPVVLADTGGRVLGVAHAGWRGLAGGVLESTLDRMRLACPDASGFRAWVGPGIGQRHFEVGADVLAAFAGRDADTRLFFAEKTPGEKWLADLASLARHRLCRAGVGDVELSGYCTYGRPDLFYSYRRAGRTGRMATLAWLAA